MGLFSYIGEKIQKAEEEAREAEMQAEEWNEDRICRELQRVSSLSKASGYAKALRVKCEKLDNWDLEKLFDDALRTRNSKACTALYPIMDERGLVHKDENGKFVRTY